MEPNPRTFPILSYVMSKLTSNPNSTDLEFNPSSSLPHNLPRLTDLKLLTSMTRAVSDIAQTRSVLQMLGDRPDHESVDTARSTIADIDSKLSKQLEEIVLSPRPSDMDRLEWRSHLAEKEKATREAAEREKRMCKAVVQLEEMHGAYENLLREAEEKLEKIYQGSELEVKSEVVEESPVNEEVVGILREALGNGIDRVDLSNRRLKFMPEAFGRIRGLVALNLSANQLGFIPDSIAGLNNLEELNLSSNLLESLPDSIGMLHNLKLLDVSTNKLNALPDSICQCRSLVELDASFNNLTYLPTNIGYEFVNLQKLSIHLNKIRSLPTSVCEMRSLFHLDAHFNELRGLPLAIGKLTNLKTLNLSSNFSDLTELPDTIGDLSNLRELDLSNNQIHALPDTFGRLDNLSKLNLDQNPIVIPPLEIVNEGVDSVKVFMAKRWLDILVEEERKNMLEMQEQTPTGWLTKGTSWLNNFVSGVSGNVGGYLNPNERSPRDPLLDQQL